MSVYKVFEHQHLLEINRTLRKLMPDMKSTLEFIPMRGDFARGIFATLTIKCDESIENLNRLYSDFYKDAPFVHLSPKSLDLKQVVNTNKCLLWLEKHDDSLVILCAIDNLLKGASGQALQNMNIMFGLDQTSGLRLKASAF